MLNRRTHIKLRQLALIVVSWLFIGILIALYDHLVLHTTNSAGPAAGYSFTKSLVVNMIAGLIGALLGGSLIVFYVNDKFQDKPYGYTILAVTLSFVGVVLIVTVVLGVVANPDKARMLKNGLVWAVVVAVTQLLMQINSKFGPGVFWNIIRGRYNTPREERRIFMFLDLNSSTTIAEKLGDKKYHAFLKDLFTDITNPILDSRGEIYQYVGDEVIVAWKYEEGVANSKCIQCFFDIKLHLERLKSKYLGRYGVMPVFKAGIHSGKVVAGEVGIIKRDITYSGDVLNTTSRIQGLCKEYNAEVIASGDLMAELRLNGHFEAKALGSIKLRGKEKEMALVALRPSAVA
ncbi:adenylate/guanylate cyclase domain-containing protein [Chitinophaga sp. GCM10012297]|uniref:Adenylate/guanylate cyclase domain-containing protein n=1 Tax=Chitinophaga chungangae TaxID=2821488 RepID=A0ABS3YAM1_9BACT|nr:adenylate/guanylate cyclase domain-containing protein [Chitinophaga chungangae]MBO9151723.1 adenylate/guanylate cyclase domain-containing protein [Chitinophaga chungangae]